jgi:small subunit ribosomal protein S6
MAKYEVTLVLDGKTTAAKKKAVLERVEKTIELLGGKVKKTDEWGVKELAYKIKKSTEGIYEHMIVECESKAAPQLSEKLRVDDEILRYLVVRNDKE